MSYPNNNFQPGELPLQVTQCVVTLTQIVQNAHKKFVLQSSHPVMLYPYIVNLDAIGQLYLSTSFIKG